MIAFVDESLRRTGSGLYVLAAVVALGDVETVRLGARDLLLPRQLRLHWRYEKERQRGRILERITSLDTHVLAYTRRESGQRRQERSRARCLIELLAALQHEGVDELVTETRHPAADKPDRQTVVRAQMTGGASPSLRYAFGNPKMEPALWLADAAAGAVAARAAGETSRYLEALGDCAEVRELNP